jgi:hypothetical protein
MMMMLMMMVLLLLLLVLLLAAVAALRELEEEQAAAALREAALHGLACLGHAHAPGSDPSLHPNQGLHAPQRRGRLLPHQVAPHQRLQLHQPPQGPKRPASLISTDNNTTTPHARSAPSASVSAKP